MVALKSSYTGSLHTWTGSSTSIPTIRYMWRRDWLNACLRGQNIINVVEALKQNGCPSTIICAASKVLQSIEANQDVDVEETDRTPLVVLRYVAGVSQDIRWVCTKFGIMAVFKFGQTLRLMLTKVKDTLQLGKRFGVVYQIPCSSGQVYIESDDWKPGWGIIQDACESETLETGA